MYKIYFDDELAYAPNLPSLAVESATLSLEENTSGSLSITLSPYHPLYGYVIPITTIISVKDGIETIWQGYCTKKSQNFDLSLTLECEGGLSALSATIQRKHTYTDTTYTNYLSTILDNHRSKKFETEPFRWSAGKCEISGTITKTVDFCTTWEAFSSVFIDGDLTDCIVSVDYDALQVNILKASSMDYATQEIHIGRNLLDMSIGVEASDIATVVIPRNSSGLLLTSDTSYTHDYVKSQDVGSTAAATYGYRWKVLDCGDTEDVAEMYQLAVDYLNNYQFANLVINANAVDLGLVQSEFDAFRLSQWVKVISTPHGLNKYMRIGKMSIDLVDPSNTRITLGFNASPTLTDRINNYFRKYSHSEGYITNNAYKSTISTKEQSGYASSDVSEIRANVVNANPTSSTASSVYDCITVTISYKNGTSETTTSYTPYVYSGTNWVKITEGFADGENRYIAIYSVDGIAYQTPEFTLAYTADSSAETSEVESITVNVNNANPTSGSVYDCITAYVNYTNGKSAILTNYGTQVQSQSSSTWINDAEGTLKDGARVYRVVYALNGVTKYSDGFTLTYTKESSGSSDSSSSTSGTTSTEIPSSAVTPASNTASALATALNNNPVVKLEAGTTYTISSTITVNNNVTLYGNGGAIYFTPSPSNVTSGIVIKNSDVTFNSVQMYSEDSYTDIEHDDGNVLASNVYAINPDANSNVTLENCLIHNVNQGVGGTSEYPSLTINNSIIIAKTPVYSRSPSVTINDSYLESYGGIQSSGTSSLHHALYYSPDPEDSSVVSTLTANRCVFYTSNSDNNSTIDIHWRTDDGDYTMKCTTGSTATFNNCYINKMIVDYENMTYCNDSYIGNVASGGTFTNCIIYDVSWRGSINRYNVTMSGGYICGTINTSISGVSVTGSYTKASSLSKWYRASTSKEWETFDASNSTTYRVKLLNSTRGVKCICDGTDKIIISGSESSSSSSSSSSSGTTTATLSRYIAGLASTENASVGDNVSDYVIIYGQYSDNSVKKESVSFTVSPSTIQSGSYTYTVYVNGTSIGTVTMNVDGNSSSTDTDDSNVLYKDTNAFEHQRKLATGEQEWEGDEMGMTCAIDFTEVVALNTSTTYYLTIGTQTYTVTYNSGMSDNDGDGEDDYDAYSNSTADVLLEYGTADGTTYDTTAYFNSTAASYITSNGCTLKLTT